MKIEVNGIYSCPFKATETIMLSELTADTEDHCGLIDDGSGDCLWDECPLREAGTVEVVWSLAKEDSP